MRGVHMLRGIVDVPPGGADLAAHARADRAPRIGDVALLALAAVAAVVHAVLRWQATHCVEVTTCRSPVGRVWQASQAVAPCACRRARTGALVVVVVPGLPAARVVALLAGPCPAASWLVVLVAGQGSRSWRPCSAGSCGSPCTPPEMLAQQREARQAVVEARRGLPVLVDVALGAVLPCWPSCLSSFFVAGVALQRRAPIALHILWQSLQRTFWPRGRRAARELGLSWSKRPRVVFQSFSPWQLSHFSPSVPSCLSSFLWQP